MRRADSEGDTQHFEHASNYGHVTIGIQKLLVKLDAVSQVKKYMAV